MNELKTKHIHYKLYDGILYVTYMAGTKVDAQSAREIVKDRLEFTNGISYPQLINDQGLVSIDKAARDYFSSYEGSAGVKAAALLVTSVFSTFLGNFFLKVAPIKIPAKLFTVESKAVDWLKQFQLK